MTIYSSIGKVFYLSDAEFLPNVTTHEI